MANPQIELDLSDMSTVDAAQLPNRLRDATVILARWANGDRKILKGEALLKAIAAGGAARPAAVLGLRLANDEQMHIVAAALQLLDAGKMDAQASLNLWSMLSGASQTPEGGAPPPATTATRYSDAATRGALRLWKQRLARHYRRFERAYADPAIHAAIDDFIHKSAAGRSVPKPLPHPLNNLIWPAARW